MSDDDKTNEWRKVLGDAAAVAQAAGVYHGASAAEQEQRVYDAVNRVEHCAYTSAARADQLKYFERHQVAAMATYFIAHGTHEDDAAAVRRARAILAEVDRV